MPRCCYSFLLYIWVGMEDLKAIYVLALCDVLVARLSGPLVSGITGNGKTI